MVGRAHTRFMTLSGSSVRMPVIMWSFLKVSTLKPDRSHSASSCLEGFLTSS
ncbi:hypothetical protein GALL_516640 [mine drainage metagenome]|uniref:Uncharacterized protein n=1 Tax=mine drainage metagenome TaxID=410659 RepID=A0A1J5PGR4_9ZZZZ